MTMFEQDEKAAVRQASLWNEALAKIEGRAIAYGTGATREPSHASLSRPAGRVSPIARNDR